MPTLRNAPAWRTTEWFNAQEPLTLDALRGRVVMICAFQMLCPGCVLHGVPQAERVHQQFAGEGVAVVGLHTVFEHHEAMQPVSLQAFLLVVALEGVLAHEISHIKHRDTLTMTLVATLAGAIMTLVQLGYFASMFGGMARDDEEGGGGPIVALLMLLFAPLAATLIQLGISRAREYEADATAARLTGNPEGLARALLKLEQSAEQIPSHATPSTAHLFIVNPLSGAGGMMLGLFRTHPPIQQRVERLLRQAGQPAPAAAR